MNSTNKKVKVIIPGAMPLSDAMDPDVIPEPIFTPEEIEEMLDRFVYGPIDKKIKEEGK